jgi:hypothetical protein
MNKRLNEILTRAKSWPRKAQNQALQSLLIIEARHVRGHRFRANDNEYLEEFPTEADRGLYLPPDVVEDWDERPLPPESGSPPRPDVI